MNENEPVARLNLPNGEVFEAKRESAHLYTFLGKYALYNHVYCFDIQDNEVQQAFYIFDFIQGFDELASYMVENDYPLMLNQLEPTKGDMEAYERAVLKDIDSRPEWLPEL